MGMISLCAEGLFWHLSPLCHLPLEWMRSLPCASPLFSPQGGQPQSVALTKHGLQAVHILSVCGCPKL